MSGLRWAEVQALVAILEQVGQPFIDQELKLLRGLEQKVRVDGDQTGIPLPVPSFYEAVDIVRNRKILNDFNNKWAGFIPGLELITNGRQLMNLAITKHNQINDIESKKIASPT